jgi:uncharacterized protein YceK
MKTKLIIFLCVVLMAGCATIDSQATKFEPLRQENNQQIYQYTATAHAIYPLDSKEAEQKRIQWLELWLIKNGLDDKNYQILARRVVPADGGILGDAFYIYYEIATNKAI